jgi:hypothetical protein
MKEREGGNQEQGRYRVNHYGKTRNFAVYEGEALIAVTLYRKGATEITKRLEEKDRHIASLKSQLPVNSESQIFPALPPK